MSAAVATALALGAASARGQAATPTDMVEAARMSRVARAVISVGYGNVVVIGHGTGAVDAFFVLTATQRDSGVLIATIEPGGSAAHPVVLERAKTPADLGISGIVVTSFLGMRDLFDIQVSHHPFMLEITRTFDLHHLFRREGEALLPRCEFDGSASSSSSKGVGSTSSLRAVTVEPVPGQPMSFMLTAIEKTVQQQNREPASVLDSTSVSRKFELQPTGTCRVLKPE